MVSSASDTAVLAASVPDPGGVWVVPAFHGLGTPYGVPHARAMIGGLSGGTTRAHLARAFLEGIAHRVADAAEAVWEACARPAALRVDGGASRNDVLLQLQAEFLGMPVERSPAIDGAALGAAALAARAAAGADTLSEEAWRPQRVFEPSLDVARREELRATWKSRLRLAAQEQH
jgi:glycerol kinase